MKTRLKNCLTNRTFWQMVCLILLLVLLDQGAKLAVNHFYSYACDAPVLMQVQDTVHIHPRINPETPNLIAERAARTGISAHFWRAVEIFECFLLMTVLALGLRFVQKLTVFIGFRPHTRLANTLFLLLLASGISCICDIWFWNGTLDFLCISKTYLARNGKMGVLHATSDIKDWYLKTLLVLVFVYIGFFIWEAYKLSKDKEADAAAKEKLKTKLRTLFHKA